MRKLDTTDRPIVAQQMDGQPVAGSKQLKKWIRLTGLSGN